VTEHDPIERRLMLAREAAWAPEAAKARVRANLVASGSLATAGAARAGSVTKLTTTLLVSMGFVAGYLLGVQSSSDPREAALTHETTPPVAPARQAAATNPAEPEARSQDATEGEPPAQETLAPSAPAQAEATLPRDAPPRSTPARQNARATPSRALRMAGRAVLARPAAPARDLGAEELALLSRAERAIRAGEPALALTFLDELESRFPSSAMLEERTAARLLAGCALSSPGARRQAEIFLDDRAASVYTDRVRRSCAIESQPAPAATAPSANVPKAPSHSPSPTDGSSRGGH
jgi:hypothetical protein